MELKNFNFPKVSELDMAFSTLDTIPELLEEAKLRGFYNGNTPENELFGDWFFGQLDKMPELKKGIDEEYANRALNYAMCLMRSFAPKHEAKEAVCALIFSETLEAAPPLSAKTNN